MILAILASLGASLGWASGSILAEKPAKAIGAFEFTRIQLLSSGAILALFCSYMGLWRNVAWEYWPAFGISILASVILGNLAMIECLRLGGPRRTEILVTMKAPIVAIIAYFWLGETLSILDLAGIFLALFGIVIAILYGTSKDQKTEPLSGNLYSVIFLGLLAALLQGIGFLVLKPAMLSGTDPFAASTIRTCGAAFIISLIGIWSAKYMQTKTAMTSLLLFKTILPGFIGYGISVSLLLYAMANFEAALAALLASLSPIFILPLLWLKTGNKPTIQASLGAACAVGGAAIIALY